MDAHTDQPPQEPQAAPRRIVIGGPTIAPPTPQLPKTTYAAPTAPGRRRGRVAAIVAGCLVVAGAGGLAARSFVSGADGGADNPEAAVEDLISAVEDEDVLGVLDALLPTERAVWGEPLRAMFDEAVRLEMAGPGADLGAVDGLELDLAVVLGPTESHAEDLSVVPVSGTWSAAVDPAALPVGPVLADLGVDVGDRSGSQPSGAVDARLATLQRGGRWYVSLAYTVAERYRSDRDALEWPEAGEGLAPLGARSPEAAVRGLLDAIEQRSLRDVLRRLDPDEAEVLQRVYGWYLVEAQASLDAALASAGVTFTLTGTDVAVIDQAGDVARVDVGGVGFQIEIEGARIRYGDGCTATTPPRGQEVTQCFGDQFGPGSPLRQQMEAFGLGGLAGAISSLTGNVATAMADLGPQGVVVREVDGEWFVSPVASGTRFVLGVLAALDAGEARSMVDATRGVVDELTPSALPEEGTSTTTTTPGTPVDRYYACQGRKQFAAVLACVSEGLDAGAFGRDVVEGIYLVPECGWVGARFDPSLFTLPDAEYVARATLSAACFDQKIFTGVIAEYQRPFELLRVECLNGKNPANMTADESLAYTTCRRGG